jgi:hypothetical protein
VSERSAGDVDQRPAARTPLARLHLWALVELFVLSGFAIAQPLLDVTGKSPDFFLFRRADRLDILLLVGLVTLLPPLGAWAVEVVAGLLGEPLRRLVHLICVTGLFVVLAVEVAKRLSHVRGPRLLLLGVAGGLLAGLLYARAPWLKLWLRYLAPAPLVFALIFLLVSPVSRLVLPARASATATAAPLLAPGEQPPAVLIFFDEFPLESLLDSKGRVDPRVYPNFAKFAGESSWYRNATGVSGFTPWAMPAMLTGRYPAAVKAPSYTEYPDNLFTLLGRTYDVKAYETISQLCPPALCKDSQAGTLDNTGLRTVLADSARLFKQIISPYDTAVDPASYADTTAADAAAAQSSSGKALDPKFRFNQLRLNQPSRFNDFLRAIKPAAPGARPPLYFLHVLLPHAPWRYQPSGTEYNYKTFGTGFQSDQTPTPIIELAHERHLLQLAYTDKLVGQVMAKLRATGLFDRSLVVLTADHGENWTPGEKRRSLGPKGAPQLMWVPLFVKAPHQRQGKVDDRNWEQVDLLPTISRILNVRVPWKMDGLDQTGPPARQRREKWWFDIPGHREVRDGPSNQAAVLRGETDTLVRASQGVRGLYRFGAFADLVYKSPQALGPVSGSPLRADLDDWDRYKRIDPASGKIPALVSGRLTSPVSPATSSVLVAVNGRIGGESQLFTNRPGQPVATFGVIVPDFLFKAGPGLPQLQAYLVHRESGHATLQPITLAQGQ